MKTKASILTALFFSVILLFFTSCKKEEKMEISNPVVAPTSTVEAKIIKNPLPFATKASIAIYNPQNKFVGMYREDGLLWSTTKTYDTVITMTPTLSSTTLDILQGQDHVVIQQLKLKVMNNYDPQDSILSTSYSPNPWINTGNSLMSGTGVFIADFGVNNWKFYYYLKTHYVSTVDSSNVEVGQGLFYVQGKNFYTNGRGITTPFGKDSLELLTPKKFIYWRLTSNPDDPGVVYYWREVYERIL